MNNGITDTAFDEIVRGHWDQIAFISYDGYRNNGRGVVAIEKISGGDSLEDKAFNLRYVTFDHGDGKPDPDSAKLIREYEPEWEIVLMYLRVDGNVRSVRVRTAPDARHPGRIHFFEVLMQEDLDNRDNPDHWKDRDRDDTIQFILSIMEERGW